MKGWMFTYFSRTTWYYFINFWS